MVGTTVIIGTIVGAVVLCRYLFRDTFSLEGGKGGKKGKREKKRKMRNLAVRHGGQDKNYDISGAKSAEPSRPSTPVDEDIDTGVGSFGDFHGHAWECKKIEKFLLRTGVSPEQAKRTAKILARVAPKKDRQSEQLRAGFAVCVS